MLLTYNWHELNKNFYKPIVSIPNNKNSYDNNEKCKLKKETETAYKEVRKTFTLLKTTYNFLGSAYAF